jgi:hypothetical protein
MPELSLRQKFRIFKSREDAWLPWVLVHPEDRKKWRRANRYATHNEALDTALFILNDNKGMS